MPIHPAPVVAAVAMLLLAGCSEPVEHLETPTVDAVPASIRHGTDAPVEAGTATGALLHTGYRATEPTIGAHGGRVYMTAIVDADVCGDCPEAARGRVERSPNVVMTEDGADFRLIYPTLPEGVGTKRSFDPMLHVDADHGRVFMDDMFPALTCDVLSFTDDAGASWTTNPVACGTPVTDHQSIVSAPPRQLTPVGYPELVYKCAQVVVGAPFCAVSPTGGLTFLPKVPLWTPDDRPACSSITGHAEAGPDGRVYLPLGLCSDGLHVFVTEDDGLSWSDHVVAGEEWLVDNGHDFDLAVDDDGNVYALWPHAGTMWLSTSQDHARTWSPPRPVSAPGLTGTSYQAIDAAAPGHVAFVYYGTTEPGGPLNQTSPGVTDEDFLDIYLNGVPQDGWENFTWNAYIGTLTDALEPQSVIETTRLNPEDDPIARGNCLVDFGCHGIREFIDIVIDGEGRPWAALVDTCTDACVADPSVMVDDLQGSMGTLTAGRSLRGGFLRDLDIAREGSP